MSAFDTIKAAYAAFGRNDPSVLFGAMDSAISWNEAEGNPLADRNPYIGPQAVGEGVFARLLAGIDNFTMKAGGATLDAPFCHVYRFDGGLAVMFQQYTDTDQWARLMK